MPDLAWISPLNLTVNHLPCGQRSIQQGAEVVIRSDDPSHAVRKYWKSLPTGTLVPNTPWSERRKKKPVPQAETLTREILGRCTDDMTLGVAFRPHGVDKRESFNFVVRNSETIYLEVGGEVVDFGDRRILCVQSQGDELELRTMIPRPLAREASEKYYFDEQLRTLRNLDAKGEYLKCIQLLDILPRDTTNRFFIVDCEMATKRGVLYVKPLRGHPVIVMADENDLHRLQQIKRVGHHSSKWSDDCCDVARGGFFLECRRDGDSFPIEWPCDHSELPLQ